VNVLETMIFTPAHEAISLIGTQGLDSRLGFRVQMQGWDARSGYKCVTIEMSGNAG
jgi:hypothetical protein